MLISKPRLNTIISLIIFLILDLVLFIYLATGSSAESPTPLYVQIIKALLVLVAIVIAYKIVVANKIVTIKNNTINVSKPWLFQQFTKNVKEIVSWQETIIRTNKTEFKELKILFTGKKKLKITLQENSNYDRVLKFVRKNAGSLEVTS